MGSDRNIRYIEFARVAAMGLIVAVHAVEAVARAGGQGAPLWFGVWIRFTVPLFLLISGFLAGLKRAADPAPEAFDAPAYLRKAGARLWLPFMAWNVVYMVVLQAAWGQPVWSAKTLFLLATGYMHLYFVFVLLQLMLLLSWAYAELTPALARRWFFWSLLLAVGFYALSDALAWTSGDDGHFFEWTYGKLCLPWAVFYFWGLWLGLDKALLRAADRWLPAWLAAAVPAFAVYLWETGLLADTFGNTFRDYFLLSGLPFQLVMATGALLALSRLERWRDSPAMRRIAPMGADIHGVYMAHVAVIMGIVAAWTSLGLPVAGSRAGLAVFVLAFAVSLAMARLARGGRLGPVGGLLFGRSGPRPRTARTD